MAVRRAMSEARAMAHGTVFDTISMATFDMLTVPTFGEEISASLEAEVSGLLGVITQSVRESAALAAMRDALLPHLMSGRLRVRDAEKIVGDRV